MTIGVLVETPLPGRCLPGLLAAYSPEWARDLYVAMLRDTLDGLQSIAALDYVLFSNDETDEGSRTIERYTPAPWRVARESPASALARLTPETRVLLARGDAPSALLEDLIERAARPAEDPFAILGPSIAGPAWLVGGSSPAIAVAELGALQRPDAVAETRRRCEDAGVALHELPPANVVIDHAAVTLLFEELQRHPERAPRTAQYFVTHP